MVEGVLVCARISCMATQERLELALLPLTSTCALMYTRACMCTRTGTGAYTEIYAGYVKVFKVFKCMRAYICRLECQCVDAMKQSRKLCDDK